MHCIHCDYLLKNLTVNRCPECGRVFDPTNPETYRPFDSELRSKRIKSEIKTAIFIAVIISPLYLSFAGFAIASIGTARLLFAAAFCLLLSLSPLLICGYRIIMARRGFDMG